MSDHTLTKYTTCFCNMRQAHFSMSFFFFNDPATTQTNTLSLHDALPILHGEIGEQIGGLVAEGGRGVRAGRQGRSVTQGAAQDRKSTRLNSSHITISYAVFCLKKKTKYTQSQRQPRASI